MLRYPFKFLDAYTREDREFFFGRDEEIARLYEMVFQADLILLHGASGTGKTSLIQCGLAGKFASHDWLSLSVRRGQNINTSLENALLAAGADGASDDIDWLDADLSSDDPMPNAAPVSAMARRLRAVYLKHFKPIYLIFDQFEELYTIGNKDEEQVFITTVRDILKVEQPVKIILSIREEYLGHLYEFERAVPELLRKKLRVEPMNLERVKTVLLGVSSQPDSNVQLEAGHEPAIAEGIFKKIRGQDKTLHIPLPYLQVFLDKFYVSVTGDENRQAEAVFTRSALAKMGDLGDVLRNFLDEQATAISRAQNLPEAEVWRALSPFVTLEGTKEPLSEAQLTARLSDLPTGTPTRLLQALVQGRILRFSEASQLYEIAHDALAKQIHAKRSDEEIAILEVQRLIKSQVAIQPEAREFFTEKQLLFIEPYLTKFKPSEAEQGWVDKSRAHRQAEKEAAKKRQTAELEKAQRQAEEERQLKEKAQMNEQRARQRTWLAAIVSVIALGLALFAWWKSAQAQELTKETNRQKIEIQSNLDSLETKEKALQFSLREAQVAKDTAEERKILADLATLEAKRQEGIAKTNLTKATQANADVVRLILANADRDILNLRYEDALEKIKAAASLGALREETARHYLEIAFWHGEAGNLNRAKNILDSAAMLVNKTASVKQPFRESIKAFDPDVFKMLMKRYYPDMVKIPGGEFRLGCDVESDSDCTETGVPRKVSDFRMARYETTWWQYALFCKVTERTYTAPSWGTEGNNPVVNVDWYDAVAYANWVSERMGLDTIIEEEGRKYNLKQRNGGYRLPSEAEWEYAARAGQLTVYAGSNELDSVGWYSGNSRRRRTEAVGLKEPNAFGLYDMSGNVWEWCWDWYDDYPEELRVDYFGPDRASFRVNRGGSWSYSAEYCRAAYRSDWLPTLRFSYLGFRLALSLEAG